MTPSTALHIAVEPMLALLPERMASAEAEVMLLAIALQESRLVHRRQIGGPARGYLQFERGGGVVGVLTHSATKDFAAKLCSDLDYKADADVVYGAIENNDVLAFGFGRLLLFSDPAPLPKMGDVQGAWEYYKRLWRPGKPKPDTWPDMYARARAVV
ncbi:hypothetical protein [Hydrocarboniphaga effusa]|uniref:hypothetical protein n=1 Tax=Hydrocarboniphaga effusa TaxID=243629 RepID=UPI00398C22B9